MLPCEADKGTSEQFKTFWATLHDQNETSVAELAPEVDEIENVELGKGSETFWPTLDPARRYDFCRRRGCRRPLSGRAVDGQGMQWPATGRTVYQRIKKPSLGLLDKQALHTTVEESTLLSRKSPASKVLSGPVG